MQIPSLLSLDFVREIIARGGEVYLVGGNVRDHLLGIPSKDHDLLVRGLDYAQLAQVLKPFGQVNLVGKSFGILKFRTREEPDFEYDLSLPRVEKSTGEGHRDFAVDFSPTIPLEQDLARRDFTINAMALEVQTGRMIDPFGGQSDLKKKLIKQVFLNTFKEDPLRLLRAVQFAARLEFSIEEETKAAMRENASLIKTVSRERIIEEIRKLFLARKPSTGFHLMRETGLLIHVFPFVEKMIGIKQPKKKNEDVYDHTMKVLDASRSASEMQNPGELHIMFAALLHDAGKPRTHRIHKETGQVTFYGHQIVSTRIARQWLAEYKAQMLGIDIDRVLNLVDNHMFETKSFYTDRAIRRFVSKVGEDVIFDLIDLRIADKKGGRAPDNMKGILNLRTRIQEEVNKAPPFTPKDLALTGHDLITMGFKPGPIFGEIQRYLMEVVLDEPELNVKEKLEELVRGKYLPVHDPQKIPTAESPDSGEKG